MDTMKFKDELPEDPIQPIVLSNAKLSDFI
jgi:hypothetical protein